MDKIVQLTQHKEIEYAVDKGKFIGNYKCHCNSLDYALKHPMDVSCIVGCLQVFNDETGVAHFVVKLHNGDIIDPTYGGLSSRLYSHIVPIEEYKVSTFKPNRELINLKQHLYDQLPWSSKLFHSPNNT